MVKILKPGYRFDTTPVKIPARFFADTDERFTWNSDGVTVAGTTLEKESRTGGITLPNSKSYTGTVVKTI